ncbi:MAG: iron ABC transporter permease [Deltaproteobacteria bacterium]|nr:iron ABC transporter permease [Deltaproteobacteria bacterium]
MNRFVKPIVRGFMFPQTDARPGLLFSEKRLGIFMLLFVVVLIAPVLALLWPWISKGIVAGIFAPAILSDIWADLRLFGASIQISAMATFISLVVWVPAGVILSGEEFFGRRFFRLACVLSFFIPPFLHALAWPEIFSFFSGLTPGFPGHFAAWMTSGMPACAWVFCAAFGPIIAILVMAGMESLDPETVAAGRMARQGSAVFSQIVFPALIPYVTAGAILVFVFCMVNFEVPDMFRVRVYPVEIFIRFAAFYDEQGAVLLSLPLVVAALVAVWFQARLMGSRSYVGTGGKKADCQKKARALRFSFCTMIFGAMTLLPVLFFIHRAGSSGTDWIRAVYDAKDALVYTLATAAGAAFLALVPGIFAGCFLARGRGAVHKATAYLSLVPLAVPPIVLAIGMIRVCNRPVLGLLYDSSLFFVFCLAICYAPFVLKIVEAGWRNVPAQIEEAAVMAEKSGFRIFFSVILPFLSPSLAAAFVTCFVLSCANLGTAVLALSPGHETLLIRMYNFMHYGAMDRVFAQGVILLAATVVCAGAGWVFFAGVGRGIQLFQKQ